MRFLSHPAEPEDNKDAVLLVDHLIHVAKRAQSIADDTGFKRSILVYYAGLFHDLGKLGPYYQEQFNFNISKHTAKKQYDNFHSPYSRWIAERIMKKTSISIEDMRKCWLLISCHHSSMKKTSGCFDGNDVEKSKRTKTILIKNWKVFVNSLKSIPEFSFLDLDIKLHADDNIRQAKSVCVSREDRSLEEFVELGFLFSALLCADKGFFYNSEPKNYGIGKINTDKNNKKTSSLASFRSCFQSHVRESVDPKIPITVINAPTGIGKTKAFLDLIPSYEPKRVFYFSPLLALTNDFEQKLKNACVDQRQFLTYNHLYTGLLNDKKNQNENPDKQNKPWEFDYESFNEPFIITTMHRLLMTVYSNKNHDKLKLASFKDALLIIDEVQTLPKFLLHNLCDIFKIMTDKMGTRVLLISATIPHELAKIHAVKMPDDLRARYLEEKNRHIIKQSFDTGLLDSGKNLVMLNTRREALEKFNALKGIDHDILYMTSGITKDHQDTIIQNIKDNTVLVSTQVIEAGIDISFSRIFRQMAPLDNIIQILGRLDREDCDKSSKLYIFEATDNKPYSSLEFKLSEDYIKDIDDVVSLYDALPRYYEEISNANNTQRQKTKQLDKYIGDLDFENVWKIVSDCIGDNYYDSVYIPEIDKWEIVKSDLSSGIKSKIKKHAGLQALLPKPAYGFIEYFDQDMLEKKILLPKKEKLADFYDDVVGLDKWIM